MLRSIRNRYKNLFSDIHFKELLTGSSISFLFKIVSMLGSYTLIWILSQKWGVTGVGYFSTYWTFLMLFSVIAKLGFDTYIVKKIPELKLEDNWQSIKLLYIQIAILICIAALILILLVAPFYSYIVKIFFSGHEFSFLLWSFSLFFISLLHINAESSKGLKKITEFAVLQNGSIYILFVIFILLFTKGFSFTDAINKGIFLSVTILLLVSFLFVRKNILRQTNAPVFFQNTKSLLAKAFPMLLANSLFLIMSWIDIIMLSALASPQEVGIYNTSLKIAALINFSLTAINSIAMPKFSELKQNDHDFKNLAQKSVLLSLAIALPLFLIFFFFPSFVLSLFGSEFIKGSYSLQTLSAGFFFSAASGAVIPILNMTGSEKEAKNIVSFTLVINLLLNSAFIPVWGIEGAAMATATSTVVWNSMALYHIYKKFRFIPLFYRKK